VHDDVGAGGEHLRDPVGLQIGAIERLLDAPSQSIESADRRERIFIAADAPALLDASR
jgi:hypothetical protein